MDSSPITKNALKVPFLIVKLSFVQMHANRMTEAYDQLIRKKLDVKQGGGAYLVIVQIRYSTVYLVKASKQGMW